MLNIFLFLSIAFLFTLIVGRLIEKIKVPWIFAALLFGFLLAVKNPFSEITSSPSFNFLAELGVYFLLFIIGFEIDVHEIKKATGFIIKSTFSIILFESLFGTLVVHFLFHISWLISFLVAISFATVGEAVLIPILEEFKQVNTKLGQAIIGIGVFDDFFEVFTLIILVIVVGAKTHTHINLMIVIGSLTAIFLLSILLMKLGKKEKKFRFKRIETFFLFVIFIMFLFIGVGEYAECTTLAALLAGISLKTFIPREKLELIESEIKTICYGFFAPIFFIQVGATININSLTTSPLLVLTVVLVTGISKILGTYIATYKELGNKKSLLLGTGLLVRFSTSLVIIKILLDNNLIDSLLYSVLIASSIIFTLIIPVIFSNMLASLQKTG